MNRKDSSSPKLLFRKDSPSPSRSPSRKRDIGDEKTNEYVFDEAEKNIEEANIQCNNIYILINY